MTSAQLRRLQWAVRATLTLGVAASVTANILHARDNPISQAIAAWPPLALLITVELVSRIPIVHRWLGVVRVVSTVSIAAIAAWISYWHMAGVVARYGETGTVPYLLPLSVDGLIIVASVSLVELGVRLRDTTPDPVRATARTTTEPTSASASGPAHRAVTDDSQTAPAPADQGAAVPANHAQSAPHDDPPSPADPATDAQPEPTPNRESVDDNKRANADHPDDPDDEEHQDDDADDGIDLAPDLVPLLPAARTARDELAQEGRTVSRDALARRLRRNGHAIRNNRVSELLNALRREEPSLNGAHPTIPI